MHLVHREPQREEEGEWPESARTRQRSTSPRYATAGRAPRPASWPAGPSPTPSRGPGAPSAAAGLRQQADMARPTSPRSFFPSLATALGWIEAQTADLSPCPFFFSFSKFIACINLLKPQMDSKKYKPSI